MSNTEKTPIDINKFLEVQSKELDVRNAEINSKNIDSHNQKEIRLKEIDKSVEVEQIEKEKMKIFFDADEKQEKRKFVIILIAMLLGVGIVVFSCYMLYDNHPYGVTSFFSSLSFIAGILSGFSLKQLFQRDIPSE